MRSRPFMALKIMDCVTLISKRGSRAHTLVLADFAEVLVEFADALAKSAIEKVLDFVIGPMYLHLVLAFQVAIERCRPICCHAAYALGK